MSGDQIVASFNHTLELICNYSSTSVTINRWIFDNKYKAFQPDFLIEQVGESATPTYSANITADRIVSWNYSTGNLVINQLTCWEDQRYTCDANFKKNTTLDVRVGAPADTPHVNIHVGATIVKLEPGQECEVMELPGTNEADILIESSVLSRPAVDFSINGENASKSCTPDGMCAEVGEVRCNLSEKYTVNFMERYLRITIKYEFLDPWKFCAEFPPPTTTSLSTAPGGSGGEKGMTTFDGGVHVNPTTPDSEEIGSTGSNNNGFSLLKFCVSLILIFL